MVVIARILNFHVRLLRQTTLCASLAVCLNGYAQDSLQDVIRGTPQAREQIEAGIYHLAIARETAHRTLLLNKCEDFREAEKSRRFDEFSEALHRELGSPDSGVLTVFTVNSQIQDAIIYNRLTDSQVNTLRKMRKSRVYDQLVEYLSFEHASLEISSGFIDAVSGIRAPWMASKALAFLRASRFFGLLLANSSATDTALLHRRDLDDIKPSDTFKDDDYLDALTLIFIKTNDSNPLRNKLPIELQKVLKEYESLELDSMRVSAVIDTNAEVAVQSKCIRSDKASCINGSWFSSTAALKKGLDDTLYENTAHILKSRYADICQSSVGVLN